MRILFVVISLGCILGYAACGGRGSVFSDDIPTETMPLIARVNPTTGPAGSVVQIFGIGFSEVPAQNVVIVGSIATTATDYALVAPPANDEIEKLTVTIPGTLSAGEHAITLLIHENPSNSNKTFVIP